MENLTRAASVAQSGGHRGAGGGWEDVLVLTPGASSLSVLAGRGSV